MTKYFNYIALVSFFLIFFLTGLNKNISTDIKDIVPNSSNKELLEEFLNFNSNKKIYFAIKDLDENSLTIIRELENSLDKIKDLEKDFFKTNQELEKFKEEYSLYFQKIDEKKLSNTNIKQKLENLYEELISSFLVSSFDENDPLEILKKQNKEINLKNGRLYIKDYGYLSIYNINKNLSTLDDYKRLYKEIKKLENKNKDIKSFSSIYYFVENSNYIKNDATKIALIATIILLVLYVLILKNTKLLINTVFTLLGSTLFASIILLLIYKKLSIFVLVFGLSISTIAVDYMFHHYFHKNYSEKKVFNKEVFLGFFTTFITFFILSFNDFTLIAQISYFSMLSLLYSYLVFSFVFPKIGFTFKDINIFSFNFSFVDFRYFLFFSILVMAIVSNQLTFNFDIKALDYDNQKLKKQEQFFIKNLSLEDKTTVLIKAQNINSLIYKREEIKKIDNSSISPLDNLISKEKFQEKLQLFNSLKLVDLKKEINKEANNIGFKNNYFKDVYSYTINPPIYNYEKLLEYEIDIKKIKNSFISYISISKTKEKEILKKDYIYSLSMKTMFENELKKDIAKSLYLGILAFILIIILLALFTKKKFLYALNFLLFPMALIFTIFTYTSINILHLFMVFIIIGLSIDYAIYSTKSHSQGTKKAILFSSLSSFAGFAVLIFSNTASLFSIGIVATFGITAILILTLFQKVKNEI